MQSDLITQFENISEQIAKYFCNKYFKSDDYWWVADNIGGILEINDYYFSLEDMLNYMKYKYTSSQMFRYYEYSLNMRSKDDYPICIRDWKKLK